MEGNIKPDIIKLQQLLKVTWAKMPDVEKRQLEPQILAAHKYLLAARTGNIDSHIQKPPRELLFVHSLLNDDPDKLIEKLGIFTWVDSSGNVHGGDVDYDNTDYRWIYCFTAWEMTRNDPWHTYYKNKKVEIPIANKTTVALLGDWGGHNPASVLVAQAASNLKRDLAIEEFYYIHLGDVYYAGTDKNDVPEYNYQTSNFLNPWPDKPNHGEPYRSFCLNSNHDMYAHGTGYFMTALRSPIFKAQDSCSYFALYNDHYRIVGLDTAFHCSDQSGCGFMNGTLGPSGLNTQKQFLHDQAKAAAQSGQKLILLSHHNGLTLMGDQKKNLWGEVIEQICDPLNGKEVLWYWGHEHNGVVYESQSDRGVKILPRCCGHGCIPMGKASDLQQNANVTWHEDQVLGPGDKYFVTNGFAVLQLDGSSLGESFYGQENITPHWSS